MFKVGDIIKLKDIRYKQSYQIVRISSVPTFETGRLTYDFFYDLIGIKDSSEMSGFLHDSDMELDIIGMRMVKIRKLESNF